MPTHKWRDVATDLFDSLLGHKRLIGCVEHGDEHVDDALVDSAGFCLEVAGGFGEGVALLGDTVQTLELLHLENIDALVLRVIQNIRLGPVQLFLKAMTHKRFYSLDVILIAVVFLQTRCWMILALRSMMLASHISAFFCSISRFTLCSKSDW